MNIISFSGGKDSAATVILCHIHNIKIDEIIFSEVMFDDKTSGELPEHINFVKNTAIPLFEKWGYKTKVLHSDFTYMDCFNHVITRSKTQDRNGKRAGFPLGGKCVINRECKIRPIKQYLKEAEKEGELCQLIGIAVDEPERVERLDGKKKRSVLVEFGYTEKMAYELAKEYGLLSPIYSFAPRGGAVGFA